VADAAAIALPGVPGGAGLGIKAGRLADAAKAAYRAGDASGVSKAADFVVDSRGTAVRNNAPGARADLESGGYPGTATTETLKTGTLRTGVPGIDGPMDVRIMNGQAGRGAYKGPRVRTTRAGTDNDGVRSDGSRFRNNESKSQRQEESHTQLGN